MFLVVGLGNPGPKYERNRHNIGFMVVDELSTRLGAGAFREKFRGVFSKGTTSSGDVVLLKPMTYMNLSGESVRAAIQFFKSSTLIVIHDEIDLEFGTIRVKVGGGTAGHNGLKSIVQHCGGPDFTRVRFGVGRGPGQARDWVLGDFSAEERFTLPDLIARAADVVESLIQVGPRDTMNRFH